MLTGAVAIRVRDVLRQIASEHELHIISGKVARDHVHLFHVVQGQSGHQPDHAVAKGNQLKNTPSGVRAAEETVLGEAFLGTWVFGCQFRNIY